MSFDWDLDLGRINLSVQAMQARLGRARDTEETDVRRKWLTKAVEYAEDTLAQARALLDRLPAEVVEQLPIVEKPTESNPPHGVTREALGASLEADQKPAKPRRKGAKADA